MLFRWEKHGAPVRRDSSHMMQNGRGRIEFCHGRCFRAQFAFSDAHASPSLLAHAAGRGRGPAKNAPRGFLPSHGLPPTMAAFRRKATQLQIQLRGKPRIPTGFLLIPPPRSAAAKGRMIRCSSIYIILISYSCTPVNILFRKRGPPPAASAGGGWVRVWARTR